MDYSGKHALVAGDQTKLNSFIQILEKMKIEVINLGGNISTINELIASSNNADLIIFGLCLEKNKLELLKKIKESREFHFTPLILITHLPRELTEKTIGQIFVNNIISIIDSNSDKLDKLFINAINGLL